MQTNISHRGKYRKLQMSQDSGFKTKIPGYTYYRTATITVLHDCSITQS